MACKVWWSVILYGECEVDVDCMCGVVGDVECSEWRNVECVEVRALWSGG